MKLDYAPDNMKSQQEFIIYSKKENLRCSRLRNEYFCADFSSKEPLQGLRDFNRNKYFLDKSFETRGLPEKMQEKIIDNFLSDGSCSEEQAALSRLIKARGGQALSADLSREVSTNFRSFVKGNLDIYIPSVTMEIAFYTPEAKSKSSIERVDIQLHYITAVTDPKTKNMQFMAMDPATQQLKVIDDKTRDEIEKKIRLIERELLDNKEYLAIQKKLSSEKSSLILAKTIEKIISEKFSLLPVTFACSKCTLTGMKETDLKVPQELFFEDRMKVDWDKDTRGLVIFEQNEFAMGSNTSEVIIDSDFALANEKSKSFDEKLDASFAERNIYYLQNATESNVNNMINNSIKKESNLLEEFIKILSKILDTILLKTAPEVSPVSPGYSF